MDIKTLYNYLNEQEIKLNEIVDGETENNFSGAELVILKRLILLCQYIGNNYTIEQFNK